ncbi:zinc transporter ZIP13-like [Stylophora pistillata]|nr:zinc transporter ZIP13-like [Stylophora pistillata]
MAKFSRISIVFLLWLSVFVSETAMVKIHRAVPRNGKQTRADSDLSWLGFEPCKFLPDLSKIFMKKEAWLYSIPATILVGMCGIFPLLVIPVEAGQALREGVTADHLKLLLSFAVGGLLGDVFLHLLPEAWAHVHEGDPHTNHFYIGFWVLAGIFGFLTLEKIFGEESEDEKNLKKKDNSKGKDVKNGTISNGCVNHENTAKRKNVCNGELHNGTVSNGEVKKSDIQLRQRHGETASHCSASKETVQVADNRETQDTEEENVKVIGYLNLLANSIDNFTHGLAVAGSFVVSTKVGLCTTCAILLHEIPHEVGDFAILLKSGFRRWDAAVGQMVTASAGLAGCVFGLIADHAGDSTAWVLPFTSGGFIYIALVTIVPDLLQETRPKESMKQTIMMIAGISCMGLVSLIH